MSMFLSEQFKTLKEYMVPHPSLFEVRKVVFLLPIWQVLIGLLVAALFYFFSGQLAGIAAFFGATISCAGSLVFAFVIFGVGKQKSENIMRQMFKAEAFKIFTIAVMFYVAIAKLGLPFLPVIIGFIATLIIFFVALLTVFK